MPPPTHIDLKKDRGLTIAWADGSTSYYSILYLRKMSPSAEARELREQIKKNPLTVLPSSAFGNPGGTSGIPGAPNTPRALTALSAELVGNYALRITFSDGHSTGIYSWDYLREIDPHTQQERQKPPEGAGEIRRDEVG